MPLPLNHEATLTRFKALPLKAVFFLLDTAAGTLVRHEVRRCPETGLTLTLKTNPAQPARPPAQRTQHHG